MKDLWVNPMTVSIPSISLNIASATSLSFNQLITEIFIAAMKMFIGSLTIFKMLFSGKKKKKTRTQRLGFHTLLYKLLITHIRVFYLVGILNKL
jgi:hypothetical protein